jgi:hypothetical protein
MTSYLFPSVKLGVFPWLAFTWPLFFPKEVLQNPPFLSYLLKPGFREIAQ